jgi:hypothetical protein
MTGTYDRTPLRREAPEDCPVRPASDVEIYDQDDDAWREQSLSEQWHLQFDEPILSIWTRLSSTSDCKTSLTDCETIKTKQNKSIKNELCPAKSVEMSQWANNHRSPSFWVRASLTPLAVVVGVRTGVTQPNSF